MTSKTKRKNHTKFNVRIQCKGEFHRKVLISCALCELMPVVMMISWACCFFSHSNSNERSLCKCETHAHNVAPYTHPQSSTENLRTVVYDDMRLLRRHSVCLRFAICTQEHIQWQWKEIPNCYESLGIWTDWSRSFAGTVWLACLLFTRRNENIYNNNNNNNCALTRTNRTYQIQTNEWWIYFYSMTFPQTEHQRAK